MRTILILIFCIFSVLSSATDEESVDFSADIQEPLTKEEKALFEPVHGSKGKYIGIRFIKNANFRGLSCIKGVELRSVDGYITVYKPESATQAHDRVVCDYNKLPVIYLALNRDFTLQKIKTVDKSLFQDEIEVMPTGDERQRKVLEKIGIKGVSFYTIITGSLMRESFSLYNQTFPKGLVISAQDPAENGIFHITLKGYNKNSSVSFRGVSCSWLESYSSPYVACALASPMVVNGLKFQRNSIAYFVKESKLSVPSFIKYIGKPVTIDGRKIKGGDTLKIDGKNIKYIGYFNGGTAHPEGEPSY